LEVQSSRSGLEVWLNCRVVVCKLKALSSNPNTTDTHAQRKSQILRGTGPTPCKDLLVGAHLREEEVIPQNKKSERLRTHNAVRKHSPK
jgi:hypothetical protein